MERELLRATSPHRGAAAPCSVWAAEDDGGAGGGQRETARNRDGRERRRQREAETRARCSANGRARRFNYALMQLSMSGLELRWLLGAFTDDGHEGDT